MLDFIADDPFHRWIDVKTDHIVADAVGLQRGVPRSGITDYSSDLTYCNEPGALNEPAGSAALRPGKS